MEGFQKFLLPLENGWEKWWVNEIKGYFFQVAWCCFFLFFFEKMICVQDPGDS